MTSPLILPILLFSILSCLLSAAAGECDQFLEGSTAWAACNNSNASDVADKELNDAYRELMIIMNKPAWAEAKKKLIAAQRAWINFRDKECELSQALIGGANHVNQSECVLDMTKERAKYIRDLYESYK